MPTYEYRCKNGHKFDRVFTIKEYQPITQCDCGCSADRIFTVAPVGFVRGDVHYRCPITNKPITSHAEHEENLARHGCRVLESGEREDAARFRAREEAEFDAKIEATTEEFVANLPADKKEQLACELDAGVDISFERA